jgi:ectoine hydroxylase-related dioxygenase (phytanoyl-CoA dioxygenase family)
MSNTLINNFNKNGFIVIKKIFKKFEIDNILSDIDIIKEKAQSKKNYRFFHKTKDGKMNTIHNIQKFYKRGYISEVTKNKKLISIVEKILNGKVRVRNIEFFLKPKKTGMASPYHQDNFYWNIVNAKALNCWIACSDASKKNGGLAYLLGSHNLGTIKHQISFAKGSSQKIPQEILRKLKFKTVHPTIGAGDCIVHHAEIIHGSQRNMSNKDRIGLVISYESKNRIINKFTNMEYEKNVKNNLKKIYS